MHDPSRPSRPVDTLGIAKTSLRFAALGAILALGPLLVLLARLGPARLAVAVLGFGTVAMVTAALLGVLLAPAYRRIAPHRNAAAVLGLVQTVLTLVVALVALGALAPSVPPPVPTTGLGLFAAWLSATVGTIAIAVLGICLGLAQRLRLLGSDRGLTTAAAPVRGGPRSPRAIAAKIGALWATPFVTVVVSYGVLLVLMFNRDEPHDATRSLALIAALSAISWTTAAGGAALLLPVFRDRGSAGSMIAGIGIIAASIVAPVLALDAFDAAARTALGQGDGRAFGEVSATVLGGGYAFLLPFLGFGLAAGLHLHRALGTPPSPAAG